MKDLTDVYIKAAKLIDRDVQEFSCVAVRMASDGLGSCYYNDEANFYASVFTEEEYGRFDAQSVLLQKIYRQEGEAEGVTPKLLRVMLLCMMAACWRDFT